MCLQNEKYIPVFLLLLGYVCSPPTQVSDSNHLISYISPRHPLVRHLVNYEVTMKKDDGWRELVMMKQSVGVTSISNETSSHCNHQTIFHHHQIHADLFNKRKFLHFFIVFSVHLMRQCCLIFMKIILMFCLLPLSLIITRLWNNIVSEDTGHDTETVQ